MPVYVRIGSKERLGIWRLIAVQVVDIDHTIAVAVFKQTLNWFSRFIIDLLINIKGILRIAHRVYLSRASHSTSYASHKIARKCRIVCESEFSDFIFIVRYIK